MNKTKKMIRVMTEAGHWTREQDDVSLKSKADGHRDG